jgi:hypothetical protein
MCEFTDTLCQQQPKWKMDEKDLRLTYAFVASRLVQTLPTHILIFDLIQTSYYLLERGPTGGQRLVRSTGEPRTSVETWRLRLMIQTLRTGSPWAFCGGTAELSFRLDLRAADEDDGLGACSTPSMGTGTLLLLPLDMRLACMDWIARLDGGVWGSKW